MPSTSSALTQDASLPSESGPYLAPIERPKGLMLKIGYRFARRQFGTVPSPFSVFGARMPTSFMSFYGKVSKLDKKLALSPDTAVIVRERVKSSNGCAWCMDAGRWYVTKKSPHMLPKLDALHEYATSPLFSEQERAALDYVSELTDTKHVSPTSFARLSKHYSEREICDIVWIAASEHLYNVTNHGLNIGSDGLCAIASRSRAGSERA